MHRFMSGKRLRAVKSSIDRIFVFFHMRSINKKALLLAAIGFMVAGCLHLLNGWVSDLPQGIHQTADDASYLAPVEKLDQKRNMERQLGWCFILCATSTANGNHSRGVLRIVRVKIGYCNLRFFSAGPQYCALPLTYSATALCSGKNKLLPRVFVRFNALFLGIFELSNHRSYQSFVSTFVTKCAVQRTPKQRILGYFPVDVRLVSQTGSIALSSGFHHFSLEKKS